MREKFPVLQRIFMPSSVVGGIILLICGPQALNIVPISPMIGKYPNFLIIIVLTCLVFGTRFDSKRARSYMDYTLVASGTYGAQLFFGVGIGALLSKVLNTEQPVARQQPYLYTIHLDVSLSPTSQLLDSSPHTL